MVEVSKMFLVPDVLPNNLRAIRDMRKLSVKQVADDLMIDRNFLAAVEIENKNFSGKTTIRALKYYGINFYKMYDIKEKRECPVTDYFPEKFNLTLIFDMAGKNIEDTNNVNVEKSVLENEIIRIAQEQGKEGILQTYKIIKKFASENRLYVEVEVDYSVMQTRTVEFDINFAKDENVQLTDMLLYRGFPESITYTEDDDFTLSGDKIIFNKQYKIPLGKDIDNYKLTSELDVKDTAIELKHDDEGKPISAKIRVIKREVNNLKAIRTLTAVSIEEMHESLGLSYNGYVNLELGNQKISSKIMWRIVRKLKVPLEAVINIDEYYDKYCEHEEKIRKPRDKK